MIDDVLQAWILPPGTGSMSVGSGLINETHGIGRNGRLLGVLQRLNTDIFAPEVHHDIHAVTTHLAEKGIPTPRLVPTAEGPLWYTAPDGGCWRMLTPVGTQTHDAFETDHQVRSAARCIAAFHMATADLAHTFAFTRPGAHDTPKHMDALRLALMTGREHRLYDSVSQLADDLFDAWSAWDGPTDLPARIIHGDLKVSNLRFDDEDEAIALIDLDTLAYGTLDVELGDALRSWCNPLGEDVAAPRFHADRAVMALQAYRDVAASSDHEVEAMLAGAERISIELAARFAKDALDESYFGWREGFGGRGEHNLLRAQGQLALAKSAMSQRQTALADLFKGS